MKELSNLLGYRDTIRVLDCTMRDGGLVNNFAFTDDFVKALYQTNISSGVDAMELGYKADKMIFDPDKFGKWKFCDDDEIFAVLGDNADKKIKLAVMADVGRCNFKEDIRPKSESAVDIIRVATYVNTIPECCLMIEDAKKKGYEVTCNVMAVATSQEADIKCALEMISQTGVDVIYIVDSYGSLYPEQIARIANLYLEYGEKYGIEIGIHSHNNQQLAFANTIEACGDGVNWLDATYFGMGRGAGNCAMENLIAFLRNPKYRIYPVIKFIEEYMVPISQECKWGYDMQYLMTGILNQHPRTAIKFTADGRHDYTGFYKEIVAQD